MIFSSPVSNDLNIFSEEPLGENLLIDFSKSFRVWYPKSSILVLGRSQKAEQEINLENVRLDKIPIFRRKGGGGCVFLDENSICVGFRYERANTYDVTPFFVKSSQRIQKFLNEEFNLNCKMHSNYDLSLKEKKFLGASLYMPKGYALYLAVILVNKSQAIANINRYLCYPSKSPNYRQNRSHNDFLTSINEYLDIRVENLQKKFQDFCEINEF